MGIGLGFGAGTLGGADSLNGLARYSPGDTIAGESFTGDNKRTYFDVNGVLQTANTGVKRDGHYIGGVRHTLLELAATNIVVSPRDLTNGAWVHTTMTPAKDQTGIDGVVNSASSILATGANATSLQTIVLASSTRAQQCWVKRLVGAGAVSMTMDNVTFTAIAVTGAWTKVTIPSQAALTNPVVGFKLAVSGDKIAVDYVDNESGTFSTSPKIGARTLEDYSFPYTPFPQASTFYAKFIEVGTTLLTNARVFQVGLTNVSPTVYSYGAAGGKYTGRHQNVGTVISSAATTPALGDLVELRIGLNADGSVFIGQSINGGAEVVAAASIAEAFAAAWNGPSPRLTLNGLGGNYGVMAFQSFKILPGIRSLAEMRAA